LNFVNNTLGEIDISRNGIYGYDIRAEVLGTRGTLKMGYLRDTPMLVMTEEGVTHDVVPHFPERFRDAYINQLYNYLENLIEEKDSEIKIEDGIAALQVALAATFSLKEKKIVNVDEF
jgi:predicted dehydrogenase